ncbi:MAG: ABC transporter substrate-binding protein [Armatimonadetes bacterium]|nr:ABC transporter substrate-binding protein [Armatimonadota bacterium]
MIPSKRSAVALALALIATAIAGAQAAPAVPGLPAPYVDRHASGEGARHGGVFVTSTISDPRTFNPIVAQETSSTAALAPVFDGLVVGDFVTGEIEPALAESWTLSPDKRTWTFRLRRGVTWHDGRPFTAADVDFTLRAIFADGVITSYKDILTYEGKRLEWKVIDPHTIALTTPVSVGIFLRQVGFTIVPKHKLEDALNRGAAAFNQFWSVGTPAREIVGTGGYTMAQYVPGQRIVYTRWSGYWKVDGKGNRLPYLTRLVSLIVPNLDQSRLKFQARETDLYGTRPREFAEFQARAARENFTIFDGPETYSTEFVTLNVNPAGVSGAKLAWFSDVRFRRALNHAIDRGAVIQQVYAGRATPAWSPVSIGNRLYHNPRVQQYPYDLARAQQLLAEAGFRRDGATGPLRDAQGNAVEFMLSTNGENNDRVAIGNIVRHDWEKLGIKVTFAPEAFNALVARLTSSYRWDAIIIGFTGSIEPGAGGRNVWLSSGSLHMWWPRQEKPATTWEAEVDRIFDQVVQEPDQAKRRAMYARWQEIIAEQVPLMHFANTKTQPSVRNTLGNVKTGLGGVVSPNDILYFKEPVRR